MKEDKEYELQGKPTALSGDGKTNTGAFAASNLWPPLWSMGRMWYLRNFLSNLVIAKAHEGNSKKLNELYENNL